MSDTSKAGAKAQLAYQWVKLMQRATGFPMMADMGLSVYNADDAKRWGAELRAAFDSHWLKGSELAS